MDLLIENGRIIDPRQGIDKKSSLLVRGGTVAQSGQASRAGCQSIDATGMIVCPGFIDLHCHLRQPGYEHKETIASGTRAAARGGFTTVCCMPNTDPPLDNPSTIRLVTSLGANEGTVRVLPIGCVTVGRRGQKLVDMVALASAGAVAFSDDGAAVATAQLMRQSLERSRDLGLPVIDHCEDSSLASDGQINEGVMSTLLKLKGIPAAAEEIIVARDLTLAKLTSAHIHIAHVSTAGSVELIRRAKKDGINVTAEATPHHLTLTEAALEGCNANAKVNPPLRTRADVDALVQGLKEGVIDIIATDHAPHALPDKQCIFTNAAFGISGLETALGSLMALVRAGHLTLSELVARLTDIPARIIHQNSLGTLASGSPADITIFDPDREWVVDPAEFASRGRNTPLAGATLKGKIIATIYQGKLVYKDDSLRIKSADKLLRGA